jgi:alkaline phosphatase D
MAFPLRRRSLFRGGFAAGLSAMIGPLAGCDPESDGSDEPTPPKVFLHGVASGDPLPTAVILWTRVSSAEGDTDVRWEIAESPSFDSIVAEGESVARADADYTVKVDAEGLNPGTTYYYRFVALDETSPVGRTKTAPEGDVARLRFAVVSCSSYAHGYFHVYRSVAARAELDAVVHLGDYIYEYGNPDVDAGGGYGDVRSYDPPHEIVSLDDYRRRYAHYRADADLQELHRQHPMIAVWDDHELTNNAWKSGAENHDPATEGDYETRKNVAARAYAEWMPIRTEEPGKIYRSLKFGSLAELVMLDTRLWGRDEQALDKDDPAIADEARSLLGADQEAWLATTLESSAAAWKLLGQQVMVMPLPLANLVNTDQWDGYVPARERLLSTIVEKGGSDVVVLTGDIHTSWAGDLVPAANEYVEMTGEGAVAVEFVVPAVTSPGLGDLFVDAGKAIRDGNPYLAYVELTKRGYVVLDITEERVQGAYFLVSQVDQSDAPEETVGVVLSTDRGAHHLVEDVLADAPEGPPLAP